MDEMTEIPLEKIDLFDKAAPFLERLTFEDEEVTYAGFGCTNPPYEEFPDVTAGDGVIMFPNAEGGAGVLYWPIGCMIKASGTVDGLDGRLALTAGSAIGGG